MRVNIYAEEMTDRVEIIAKEIDGQTYTGLRLYLELPVTMPDGSNHTGPFMHRPGDDDSAAVTFWGKRDLRTVLLKMLDQLDAHYGWPSASHKPLCWIPEDELPASLPSSAYDALYPHSRVDLVREFPVYAPAPITQSSALEHAARAQPGAHPAPMLYQHDDSRYGLSFGPARFAAGDPAWHRVPIDVIEAARAVEESGND